VRAKPVQHEAAPAADIERLARRLTSLHLPNTVTVDDAQEPFNGVGKSPPFAIVSGWIITSYLCFGWGGRGYVQFAPRAIAHGEALTRDVVEGREEWCEFVGGVGAVADV